MIALLHGQIAFKSIDHLIIDVGGVGYRLLIPLSTLCLMKVQSGSRSIRMFVRMPFSFSVF
jgi:Holliday junction resolvasome RuvABC DNA-binding subunit